VIAEVASDGRTTSEDDAKGITEALERAGESVESVDVWLGDRRHAGDSLGGEKSNWRLLVAFACLRGLCRPGDPPRKQKDAVRALPEPLRKMRVPRKWEGSVFDNARLLNDFMIRRRVHFPKAAATTLQGIRSWRGRQDDPEKDACDAFRYATIGLLESKWLAYRAA
jgi:hypothetical protein